LNLLGEEEDEDLRTCLQNSYATLTSACYEITQVEGRDVYSNYTVNYD